MIGMTRSSGVKIGSEKAIEDYNTMLDTFQGASEEIDRFNETNKEASLTRSEKMDAGWRTNFWGYAPVKEAIEATADERTLPVTASGLAGLIAQTFAIEHTRKTPVDETFTFDVKAERLKKEGISAFEWDSFMSATNSDDLEVRISRHNKMKDAYKDIASMPITESLAYSLIPAIADPATGSFLFGAGKILKSFDVANKLTGMSRVIYNSVEGAALAGSSVALSEYLIQDQNYIKDQERVDDAAMFGAALGFALPMIPSAYVGASGVASQALASRGVHNALKSTGVKDFVQKNLTFNPMDGILTSTTATKAMKEWVEKADTLLFAKRDVTGKIIPSPSEVAMGYRDNMMGGTSDIIMKQIEEAKATGKTISEVDNLQMKDHFEYVNTSRQMANEEIIGLSAPERVSLYKQITGASIKVNKKGKFEYPVDFYNVLENHYLKTLRASNKIAPKAGREHIAQFYKKFSDEGTTLKQPGLTNKAGDVYMQRYMDRDVLLSDKATSIKNIEEMLLADKLNKHLIETGELTLQGLKDTASGIYSKAIESDMRYRYLGEGAKDSATPTRMRSLRMNTSLHPEMFGQSMQRAVLEYADNMSGKLAANKFFGLTGGINGNHAKELDDVLEGFVEEGASVKDIKNMQAIIETVYGTRKFQNNPHAIDQMATRIAKKSAGALYGAGFSRYTIAELGAVIAKNGLGSTIKAFLPAHQQMLKLINGTASDDPILKLFTDMHLAGQYLGMTKNDRFDTLALQHNVGTVERNLDTVNHWGRKVSFFAQLQDTIDFMAGGAYFNEVFKMSKNINKMTTAQESRMGRYGLSKEDIVAIGKENIIYHNDGKTVKDYNIGEWNDQELAKKFHFGLQHAVKDTIVRTDGTRISRHLSDNSSVVKQLMFQYMQFPTAAFERLVVNMEEYEARTAVGLMSSIMLMYGINELSDAAMVKMGVKNKRASTEDMILKSVLSTPFSGLSGTIYDTLAGSLGFMTSGGYTPRPGEMPAGAALGAVAKVSKYSAMSVKDLFEGEYKEAFKDISNIAPILNALTFVNIGFKTLAGQEKKEYPVLGKPFTSGGDTKDPLLLKILNGEEE